MKTSSDNGANNLEEGYKEKRSLPLSNQLLKDLVIIDPKLGQEVSTEAVVYTHC